jgi:N-acetylneuraminic acid mutarotase
MNKKNWLGVVLACAIALTSFNSCKKSEDTEEEGATEWVKASAFEGDPRSNAASFQINEVGYLATGVITSGSTTTRTKDAWTFKNNIWSPIAPFAGAARQGAVGFSVGNFGYVGLGSDGQNAFGDFYKYDPANNTWTEIAPFPGEARYGAVAFTLGNVGYVGLGATNNNKTLKDFWKYDPSNNTWTQIGTEFENKRVYGFAFVIAGKAYVGGGIDNNQYPEDFFSFDGTKWTKLAPLKDTDNTYDLTRHSASTFVIGNYGYVVGGRKASVLSNVWKYDPAANEWVSKHQALPQNAREGAVAFSIGGKGYLTTGMNGTNKFDDTWVFTQAR